MPSATANKTFADVLANAIGITDPGAVSNLEAAVNAWNGGALSDAELAMEISQFTADVRLRDTNFETWANGTPTGGVGANGTGVGGYYPINYVGGGSVLWPSPSYLAATMGKGDPGRDAKQDVNFSFTGAIGANEFLQGQPILSALTLNPAGAVVQCVTKATNPTAIRLRKNGADWGTITFTSASFAGVVAIANPTLAPNDLLTYIGPAVQDPTLSTVYGVIPSTSP